MSEPAPKDSSRDTITYITIGLLAFAALPWLLPGLRLQVALLAGYIVLSGLAVWTWPRLEHWLMIGLAVWLLLVVGFHLRLDHFTVWNGMAIGGGLLLLAYNITQLRSQGAPVEAESGAEPEGEEDPAPPRPRKRKRTAALLAAGQDEEDVFSVLYNRILRYHGPDLDLGRLNDQERAFLLVYHVKGIVDNGGFSYLFEGGLPGDPHYQQAETAYQAIGCEPAAAAFRKALALFPDSRPPEDAGQRLKIYRAGPPNRRSAIDNEFWDAGELIERCLREYIRAHAGAYTHLDAPPARQRKARKCRAEKEAPSEWMVKLTALPHWCRVALAARWGRRVLPTLRTTWAGAQPDRLQAIQTALTRAEQSAAEGRPAAELDDAIMHALIAAGAAMLGLHGDTEGPPSEPLPPDGNAAVLAAAVAKVAESAARAAERGPAESAHEAKVALNFAWTAANDDPELGQGLEADFEALKRVAARGQWTDDTPVPADVWTLIG